MSKGCETVMKRLMLTILSCVCGLIGCDRKPEALDRQSFAEEAAGRFRMACPGCKVVVSNDLELRITGQDGQEHISFLNNAFDICKQDPKEVNRILARLVAAEVEMLTSREDIARERVVPIVKDRAWLVETKQALLDRGAEETPEHIVEDLNGELVIVYACDTPTRIRYLSPDDLSKLGIEPNELHDLACENLTRILPRLVYCGYHGVYMVVAGGDYEASLLLLDSVWSTNHVDVKGDIVVAIPKRDLLIATGSEDPEGLLKVREMAGKAYDEGPYRLTPVLFVRSGGRFKVWDEGKHPD